MTDVQAKKAARADLATRAFVLFVLVSVIGALTLLVVLTVQNYHRGKDNRALLQVMHSCTSPGQPCYQRGQEQTAQIVAGLTQGNQRAAAAAASCAATLPHPDFLAVYRCTMRKLANP